MSLQAMTNAVGKVLTQANRGATLIQVAERILLELVDEGYELRERIDTGLSPMKQGAIELHEIFTTLKEQGFTEDQAFALTEKIFETNLDMFRDRS